MSEERRKILEMLANQQISADDAARLLDKIDEQQTAQRGQGAAGPVARSTPRYLRIQADGDDAKVNVQIPLALIKSGINLSAMLPNATSEGLKTQGVDINQFSGMAADELVAALTELRVAVDDQNGEKVRIYCE